jgi:hypothetical protein
VFAVIAEHGLENLTQKQVLRHSETKLGLEEKELKERKEEVSKLIDEYIAGQGENATAETEAVQEEPARKKRAAAKKEKEESDISDLDDDDEEEEAPAKKKPKKEAPAEKKEKDFRVETATGEECPKKIKDLQRNAMKRSQFLARAPEMNLELWGNKLMGRARSFTSDNMGWYTGGKIQIDMGDGEMIWGQIGINLTVFGSKEWKK